MPAYRPSAAMTLPGCSAAIKSAMSESLATAATKAPAAARKGSGGHVLCSPSAVMQVQTTV